MWKKNTARLRGSVNAIDHVGSIQGGVLHEGRVLNFSLEILLV